MNPTEPECHDEKKPSGKSEGMMKSSLIFSKHYHVSIMVGLITVSTIGILGYSGYRLDLYMGTNNVFLVIGLLISFPISQILIYKWIKEKYIPRVKKNNK